MAALKMLGLEERTPPEFAQHIKELLEKCKTPKATNRPVLAINQHKMQLGKNGGFPKWLYHQDHDPVHIMNQDEEDALVAEGFEERYIPKDYPVMLYRRNMAAKFGPPDLTKPVPAYYVADYVESIVARDKEHLKRLHEIYARELKLNPNLGYGPWVKSIDDIEPLAQEEDAEQTIARLEGQLAEARLQAAGKKS